ncbi:MAG: DUF805 domain-containing protein [Bifidobacteriaceae bacterium]|jgi:uncharacterized membrane protein YhaH (DUF805 family)|nr:DUF805 domain-containing protein [Bifidobacteriaceae bacterium]
MSELESNPEQNPAVLNTDSDPTVNSESSTTQITSNESLKSTPNNQTSLNDTLANASPAEPILSAEPISSANPDTEEFAKIDIFEDTSDATDYQTDQLVTSAKTTIYDNALNTPRSNETTAKEDFGSRPPEFSTNISNPNNPPAAARATTNENNSYANNYRAVPPAQPIYVPQNYHTSIKAPLEVPWRDIHFGQAIKRGFQKYAVFKGRSSLPEYWYFIIFNFILNASLILVSIFGLIPAYFRLGSTQSSSIDSGDFFWEEGEFYWGDSGYNSYDSVLEFIGIGFSIFILFCIFALVMFIPTLAVTVRRLHDVNRPGYLAIIGFLIPVFGSLLLFYFLAQPQVDQDNPYNI